MSRSGPYCCVPLCRSEYGRDTSVSFHEIPQEAKLRRRWIQAIRRDVGPNFAIRPGVTKVCGRHFTDEDYCTPSASAIRRRSTEGRGGTAKRRLRPGTVPSVFPFARTSTPSTKEGRKPPAVRVRVLPTGEQPEQPEELAQPSSEADLPSCDSVDADGDGCSSEVSGADAAAGSSQSHAEDASAEALEALRAENAHLRAMVSGLEKANGSLQAELYSHVFSIRRFSAKAHMVRMYTGFVSFAMFMACFRFLHHSAQSMRSWQGQRTILDGERHGHKPGPPPKLDLEAQFFMVCVRLRCGLLLEDLADRFKVSASTLSRYFTTWVNLMFVKFREINVWPSRRRVDRLMPSCFKAHYPSTRAIIDCTEFFIERPSSLSTQSSTFSGYKNHNTLKSLIGISPNGYIVFVSCLYEGSITDRDTVIQSGIVNKLEHGDSIMADKGFDIQDLLVPHGVRLNIPPFNTKAHQMLPQDVMTTKKIAAVRIHVERAIGRIKEYRLLDGVMDNNLFDIVEQMIYAASMLCNFKPPLVAA